MNIGAGLLGALPNIVVFQFNPDRVTRTPTLAHQPPRPDGTGNRTATQQPDDPAESTALASDSTRPISLPRRNPVAAASGILPTLSALNCLMVPSSSSPSTSWLSQSSAKPSRCLRSACPTVLFFGDRFVSSPVTITALSITETEYDPLAESGARRDLSHAYKYLHPASWRLLLSHWCLQLLEKVKEVMAALNLANAASARRSSICLWRSKQSHRKE